MALVDAGVPFGRVADRHCCCVAEAAVKVKPWARCTVGGVGALTPDTF